MTIENDFPSLTGKHIQLENQGFKGTVALPKECEKDKHDVFRPYVYTETDIQEHTRDIVKIEEAIQKAILSVYMKSECCEKTAIEIQKLIYKELGIKIN